MKGSWKLVLLTAIGSALCWWPSLIWPEIHSLVLGLFPLVVIGVLSGVSAARSGWLFRLAAASTLGTLIGISVGATIWPNEDGIAQSYIGIAIVIATVAAALVSLIVCLTVRFFVRMRENRIGTNGS
jgi:hypothetical protein